MFLIASERCLEVISSNLQERPGEFQVSALARHDSIAK